MAWFSLRVREVTSSILGWPLFAIFNCMWFSRVWRKSHNVRNPQVFKPTSVAINCRWMVWNPRIILVEAKVPMGCTKPVEIKLQWPRYRPFGFGIQNEQAVKSCCDCSHNLPYKKPIFRPYNSCEARKMSVLEWKDAHNYTPSSLSCEGMVRSELHCIHDESLS